MAQKTRAVSFEEEQIVEEFDVELLKEYELFGDFIQGTLRIND
jgi:hypothetical protein